LATLLNINKSVYDFAIPAPVRLLGIRKDFKPLIKLLPAPVIIQNNDYRLLDNRYAPYLDIERRAENIYALITKRTGDTFFERQFITV
jgi:hypothetical protein